MQLISLSKSAMRSRAKIAQALQFWICNCTLQGPPGMLATDLLRRRQLAQRNVSSEAIHQVVYSNALKVYSLNTEIKEEHWLALHPESER